MLAFVVSAAPPPPPPPPPPVPVPASASSKSKAIKPVPTVSPRAAPVQAPREIVEETHVDADGEDGVPGDVEGGIPGGLLGGVVGGILTDLPPPPPPPPPSPPVARDPVRVGGELKTAALIERVEPEYPPLAVRAQVQGVVILEAVVDRQGTCRRRMDVLSAAVVGSASRSSASVASGCTVINAPTGIPAAGPTSVPETSFASAARFRPPLAVAA